jgi:hypothetical protein
MPLLRYVGCGVVEVWEWKSGWVRGFYANLARLYTGLSLCSCYLRLVSPVGGNNLR